MNSLTTALGALALSFALTVIAAAQGTGPNTAKKLDTEPAQTTAPNNSRPRLEPAPTPPGAPLVDPNSRNRYPGQPEPEPMDPYGEPAAPQSSTPQTSPLPLAQAKKRYLVAQVRLQNLVKDGSPRSLSVLVKADNDSDAVISFHEPRDLMRSAVADDFDARRQLQQAELAELENRIIRIKRALEIRDAMRETIIEQRTDELLEQMEAGEAHPALPEAKEPAAKSAAKPSAGIDPDASERKSRLLELAVDEAIATFEAAERAYRRLEKLRASGAIEQAVLDEQIEKLALARTQLERAAVKAALDVKEAEANLDSAERAFKRAEKLQASGAIEQSVLDQQLDQYNRAIIQLDRAESNVNMFDRVEKRLEALDRGPAADGAVNDPKKVSADQP